VACQTCKVKILILTREKLALFVKAGMMFLKVEIHEEYLLKHFTITSHLIFKNF
jgi:hypothetical protein